MARESAWPLGRGNGGPATVVRGTQRSIGARNLLLLALHRREASVTLSPGGKLRRGRARPDTAGAAVEAHMVDVVDDRTVVHVGDVGRVDVRDRAVVEELATAPVTAL